MQTLFKSHELRHILVESGYSEPEKSPTQPSQSLCDDRKKDAKAMFFLQSALDDDIFPRISSAKSSKEAWEIIKREYFGDKNIITVKLPSLHSEFKTLNMNHKEGIEVYLSRVSCVLNQMRSYGEIIINTTIVSKVLRSLKRN